MEKIHLGFIENLIYNNLTIKYVQNGYFYILKIVMIRLFSHFILVIFFNCNSNHHSHSHSHSHSHQKDGLHHWEIPSKDPDRIILTFNGNPSTKRAVTWRTDSSVKKAEAQIAVAGLNSDFVKEASTYTANTEEFDLGLYKSNKSLIVNYHSVVFENLKPKTLYAYRVGFAENWSEWIQFKTANDTYSPTQFVYFGDAQNDILNHWSRVIRMAYKTAPDASFVIHAGDLVDSAHKDNEWAQWFKAGGFIHSQWTAIPVVGNHEFQRFDGYEGTLPRRLSIQWRPQFTLPVEENLDEKLHETVYSVEYQDILVLVLNSTGQLEEQTEYIREKLTNSDAKWKIVTNHHSVFSPAEGRDFEYARKVWKPMFEKYGVDLVLNGHDHTYARGHTPVKSQNVNESGIFKTLYVTSVSGPKQYKIDKVKIKNYEVDGYKSDKMGEETQFFQVINIDNNKLTYSAYTTLGDLYDRAIITKDFSNGEKTISNQ